MRHVKVVVGLIVAVCLFGLTAASALAAGFESKPNGKTKDLTFKEYGKKAGEPSAQTFKIGPIKYHNAENEPVEVSWKIKCANAKGTGTAPAEGTPSPTLTVKVTYQKCTYTGTGATEIKGEAPHATFLGQKENPATFKYYVGGEKSGEVNLESSIEIKLAGPKCIVTIPSQESEPFGSYVPAKYSNSSIEIGTKKQEKEEFPSGFRNRLIIENAIVVHPLSKPEEKEIPEKAGLAYEVAPITYASGPHEGEPVKTSLCLNIPEEETIEVEHIKGVKEHEKVDPREEVNGTYTGSDLKLELPKGELKVTL